MSNDDTETDRVDKRILQRVVAVQDRVIQRVFVPIDTAVVYYTFAFVFIFFGIQKFAPGTTPVRTPVGHIITTFGLPIELETAMMIIGLYEVFLGLLFVFKETRLVFTPFFVHQFISLLVLVAAPYAFFQPPYIDLFGVDVPWILGSFSAFVLKNVVFIAAFVLLVSVELEREQM